MLKSKKCRIQFQLCESAYVVMRIRIQGVKNRPERKQIHAEFPWKILDFCLFLVPFQCIIFLNLEILRVFFILSFQQHFFNKYSVISASWIQNRAYSLRIRIQEVFPLLRIRIHISAPPVSHESALITV